jgi:hypothetical protein
VIVSPDGYIVTNNHVIARASEIEIIVGPKLYRLWNFSALAPKVGRSRNPSVFNRYDFWRQAGGVELAGRWNSYATRTSSCGGERGNWRKSLSDSLSMVLEGHYGKVSPKRRRRSPLIPVNNEQ